MVFTSGNNNQEKATGKLAKKRKALYIGIGIATMLMLWQVLSLIFSEFIVASPAATLIALGQLAANGSLWSEFGYSLARLLIGLIGGCIIGVGLGILAGLNKRLQFFLEPMRWAVMTVPAIIISVLAMLWFGLGSTQVVFMTGIITMPISYVSTLEGMLAIDARILEMAAVYKIPPRLRLTQIYLPGIGSSVMAGLTLASGIGVRASILAEFIGARNGIGHNLFLSWTFLDTPALFAWILMAFALLGLVEFGALKPIRDYLTRWKRTT
jgi:NitT/TauT family transport system permease protein